MLYFRKYTPKSYAMHLKTNTSITRITSIVAYHNRFVKTFLLLDDVIE